MAKKSLISLLEMFLLIFLCVSCGKMEHGVFSATGYQNPWAELYVPARDGWTFIEGQELAEYLGVDYNASDTSEEGISYEFRMEKDGGFPSLTLTFEYVGKQKIDVGNYLDTVAAGMESDEEIAFSCMRGSKVRIAGEMYDSLYILGTYGSSTVYEQYFARKLGDYIVCFVSVDIGTDTTETDALIASIVKP